MLAKLFASDNQKTFEEGLRRLVQADILQRACRGIYINKDAASFDQHVIERIVQALRLCYGGQRVSEDLDFTGGKKFPAYPVVTY